MISSSMSSLASAGPLPLLMDTLWRLPLDLLLSRPIDATAAAAFAVTKTVVRGVAGGLGLGLGGLRWLTGQAGEQQEGECSSESVCEFSTRKGKRVLRSRSLRQAGSAPIGRRQRRQAVLDFSLAGPSTTPGSSAHTPCLHELLSLSLPAARKFSCCEPETRLPIDMGLQSSML